MSRRFLAVLALAALLAQALPVLAGGPETFTRDYHVAVGAHAVGTGVSVNLCSGGAPHPEGCDLDDDGQADVPTVGGGNVFASTPRRNVVVTAVDAHWDADVAMAVCLYRPFSDFVCDGEDDVMSASGCGEARIENAPYASEKIAVFLYTALVLPNGHACGATEGTLTAVFS